jgi:4-amino-4-deoxy-L-arabinose transferase-like glycosyltransferase
VRQADSPPALGGPWWWLVAWAVLVAVALVLRPLLPVDETRYLSVAWEMWRRGDWLVPSLNGAPYSDKPPLLFWCILLGWRVFGVNEWWPRLLSPLYALASVLLLIRLSRHLSPGRSSRAEVALPFMSGALWVTYSTLVLFDTLLALCVLIALSGVVEALRGHQGQGWLMYGAGLGLGALAKGPVVLVHALPVALLAPWWEKGSRPAGWRAWYLGVIGALGVAAALGFGWALSAGSHAGRAYEAAILWKQTAGRMAKAFAHQRPWWWYLPLLPLVLFPWSLWPPLWKALAAMRSESADLALRFALACIIPAVFLLSLISGKQVHYLMPVIPPFAILAGSACARVEGEARRRQIVALSLVSPVLLISIHLAGMGLIRRSYDLRPSALILKHAEDAGDAIGYVGHYEGQFHFLGRLTRPIDELTPAALPGWITEHPNALVIRYQQSHATPAPAVFVQPYRDGTLSISQEVNASSSRRTMSVHP